ncbi:Mitochondrial 39S ribosomal protein L33 [Caligus rogercresseyi]|uniref:Mitochondrial 39S ribosomal protein L33 n=1 Tax=Caligus rogercresseyi TaxID=217165 RepID=A0A7T8QVY0_CALRO|nr:Mitochondrial 39S ribosomal protein L33 [Caligus rogercresseyi]
MVHLTSTLGVALSSLRLATNKNRGKAKSILVECRSVISGHKEFRVRPRLSEEKIELSLYKEQKKTKSIRDDKHLWEVEIADNFNKEKDTIFKVEDVLKRPFYHTKVES